MFFTDQSIGASRLHALTISFDLWPDSISVKMLENTVTTFARKELKTLISIILPMHCLAARLSLAVEFTNILLSPKIEELFLDP